MQSEQLASLSQCFDLFCLQRHFDISNLIMKNRRNIQINDETALEVALQEYKAEVKASKL